MLGLLRGPLGLIVLAGVIAVGAYWAGRTHAANAWKAKELERQVRWQDERELIRSQVRAEQAAILERHRDTAARDRARLQAQVNAARATAGQIEVITREIPVVVVGQCHPDPDDLRLLECIGAAANGARMSGCPGAGAAGGPGRDGFPGGLELPGL